MIFKDITTFIQLNVYFQQNLQLRQDSVPKPYSIFILCNIDSCENFCNENFVIGDTQNFVPLLTSLSGLRQVVNKLPSASLILTNDQSDNLIHLIYISHPICNLTFFHYLQYCTHPRLLIQSGSFVPMIALACKKKLQTKMLHLK